MSQDTKTIEVSAPHLSIVRSILRDHVPLECIWAFGSRIHGRAKPFSDLDLVVVREGHPLPLGMIAALAEAFSESELPFKVDLVQWNDLSPEMRDALLNDHVEVVLN